MNTKDKILNAFKRNIKSKNNFDLIIDILIFHFQKFSEDINFSEYSFSKNCLNLLLIKNELYNLHLELTNHFIQIQFYDNSEMLIYFENDLAINDIKTLISSIFNGKFEIEIFLDSSNNIVSKKLKFNDVNLSKFNKEYKIKIFKNEFLKVEKHKGISLF